MNKTTNIQTKNNKNNNNKTTRIITTNTKLLFVSIAILVALALILSPIVGVDNAAATKHHKKHKGNYASQSIDQSQSSLQSSSVESGDDTKNSGNNSKE